MATGGLQPAVSVRGLTKRFGEHTALDAIDLNLGGGELRGLLGPNGAGKTTLLRVLFGLIRADAGTIELTGGTAAGFVEEPAFYPYLSGRGNLELLSELDGGARPQDIDEALERVDLGSRARSRVAGYSTGMRQRLGIAAALIRHPRLLLLDEPTSGLDPAGVRAVAALLRDLADDGVAVLLSSHQIGELEMLCHSYTVIRSGRVVWDGAADRARREAPGSVYSLQSSDDHKALEIAAERPRVHAVAAVPAPGLQLSVEPGELDGYVLALAGQGVAVRRLALTTSPLQALFFSLTGGVQ